MYIEQPLGFVAQGEIGRVCCLRKSLYGLNRVRVRDLVNSAKPLRNLACKRVNLTTLFSTRTPAQVSFCW